MNCENCREQIEENWSYCPGCGTNQENIPEYFSIPENYLTFRDANVQYLRENYESLSSIGILTGKTNRLRPTLGDYASIDFFQLMMTGMLAYAPHLIEDTMRIARLVGYFMVYPTTETTGIKQALALIRKKEKNTCNIPANPKITSLMKKTWEKTRIGLLEKVSAEDGHVTYEISEVGCGIQAFSNKYCSLAANLCGIAEGLTNTLWTGKLLECGHKCNTTCKVQITPGDQPFTEKQPKQKEYEKTNQTLIQNMTENKPTYPRPKLGPHLHISLHQSLNYTLLNATPGHKTLYLHTAQKTGQKIPTTKKQEILKQQKICLTQKNQITESLYTAKTKKTQPNQNKYIKKILNR